MSSQKILIQLPAAQHAALKALADHVGLSVAAQARIAFQYYLDIHAPKPQTSRPTTQSGQAQTLADYQSMVATPIVFTSDAEANQFMQTRAALAKAAGNRIDLMPLPAWVIEQVESDGNGGYALLRRRVTATTEDQLAQEREAFATNKPLFDPDELNFED